MHKDHSNTREYVKHTRNTALGKSGINKRNRRNVQRLIDNNKDEMILRKRT